MSHCNFLIDHMYTSVKGSHDHTIFRLHFVIHNYNNNNVNVTFIKDCRAAKLRVLQSWRRLPKVLFTYETTSLFMQNPHSWGFKTLLLYELYCMNCILYELYSTLFPFDPPTQSSIPCTLLSLYTVHMQVIIYGCQDFCKSIETISHNSGPRQVHERRKKCSGLSETGNLGRNSSRSIVYTTTYTSIPVLCIHTHTLHS